MTKPPFAVEFFRRRGIWYWRVRHKNGNIVAVQGEGKKRQVDCRRGFFRLEAAFKAGTVGERVAKEWRDE